ncbi:transmembrane protein 184C-like [Apostichopus japonicus]|uniref:transmembrane protein 184C-like n=1 Tax=Stichopus japonicus TaxID=307972 RepID=UPI003AB360A8
MEPTDTGVTQIDPVSVDTFTVDPGTVDPVRGDPVKGNPNGRRWTWRRWVRPVYIIAYSLIVCVALPLIIWDAYSHQKYFKAIAWPTAGFGALVAIGVTGYLMLNHIVYFSRPNQQRYILRILLIVPIYSINASFVLRWPKSAIYLDTICACYKSFVLYCFLFYLIHYLTEHYDVENHLAKKEQIKSPVPFCCIKPGPNKRLLRRCRNGVLNFVVLGPILALGLILAYSMDRNYTQGEFSPSGTWFWLTIVNILSQLWASYCLTVFYNATSEETYPLRALPQMLCVKFCIFISFLQQVIISLLVDRDVITSPEKWGIDKNGLSVVIHNFCLSIELAVLSFVQLFAFSHKPYMDKEPLDFRVSCRLFCDYTDLQRDIKDHSGKMMRDITTLGRNNEGSTTDEDDTSSHDEEKMKENWSSPDKDMFVYSKDISDDSSTSEV